MHIGERLEQLCREEPDGPAVQFEGKWWTWADMDRIHREIEAVLAPANIGIGEGIGLVLRERPHTFGAYLSILRTRRCAVLVTPIQPDAPMAADIRGLRLRVLIADGEDWKRAGVLDAARDAGTLGIELTGDKDDPVRIVGGIEKVGAGEHFSPTPDVAVTLLTSGTTGQPKRVPVTYDVFESRPPEHERPPWKRGIAINAIPLVSVGGAIGIGNTVWRGRPTALMDRFDVLKWAELVHEHKPRHLAAPPATLRMLLDRGVPKEYLESGEVFIAASSPVDLATTDEFEAVYGIPVVRGYGATEFMGAVTGFVPEDYPLAKVKRGSVGRATNGSKIRIVDPQTGAELPRGEVGILEADPARRPAGVAPGWMRTNDLARMDEDGFVWIEGRVDGVIIRGGFKVQSSELEAVLKEHPAIADAGVVGLEDPTLNQVPVAAIVLKPGAKRPDDSELMDLVRSRKPPYYVPTKIVVVDELPRNAMLKVVPSRLKDLIQSR